MLDRRTVDLDASVERDRSVGIRKERIDIHRYDHREIDDHLGQGVERCNNGFAVRWRVVTEAGEQPSDAGSLDQVAGQHRRRVAAARLAVSSMTSTAMPPVPNSITGPKIGSRLIPRINSCACLRTTMG